MGPIMTDPHPYTIAFSSAAFLCTFYTAAYAVVCSLSRPSYAGHGFATIIERLGTRTAIDYRAFMRRCCFLVANFCYDKFRRECRGSARLSLDPSRKVFVTLGVGRFQEWTQMYGEGFSLIAVDPDIDLPLVRSDAKSYNFVK